MNGSANTRSLTQHRKVAGSFRDLALLQTIQLGLHTLQQLQGGALAATGACVVFVVLRRPCLEGELKVRPRCGHLLPLLLPLLLRLLLPPLLLLLLVVLLLVLLILLLPYYYYRRRRQAGAGGVSHLGARVPLL